MGVVLLPELWTGEKTKTFRPACADICEVFPGYCEFCQKYDDIIGASRNGVKAG